MARSNGSAPLFSIITVCRNADTLIGPTVASLRSQRFRDFEYLVIDGASTDETLSIVRERAAGLDIRITSEPDRGIYDAMNKGVMLARGSWVYFLNAGDDLVDDTVLQRVAEKLEHLAACALAYGDVYYRGTSGLRKIRFEWLTRRNLVFEHLCHQAVFANRSAFARDGLFNTQYTINADYEWMLRVAHRGGAMAYLDLPIAYYDDNGISAQSAVQMKSERALVRNLYLPKGLGSPIRLGYRAGRKILRSLGLSNR